MAETSHHMRLIRRMLVGVLAVAAIAAAVFAIRLATSTANWRQPPQPFEPIAAWMTPRYVARSWQVPPEVVADALALQRDGNGRRITLSELAAQQGVEPEALIVTLVDAITAYRDQPRD